MADWRAAKHDKLIFEVYLADKASAAWESLDWKHLGDLKNLLANLGGVLNWVLHVLGHVGGGESLEIAYFVVKGHGESWENKLTGEGWFLLVGFSGALADELKLVLESISME